MKSLRQFFAQSLILWAPIFFISAQLITYEEPGSRTQEVSAYEISDSSVVAKIDIFDRIVIDRQVSASEIDSILKDECCGDQFVNTRTKIVLPAIIFCGQSNMEGGDNTGSNVAGSTQVGKAFTWYKPDDSTATDNGYFETLFFTRNNNWRAVELSYAGPELNFAKQWSDNHTTPIVILKYALSGSALVDDGTVYANGYWQVTANPANGPPHYKILKNNFLIPAIRKLQAKGIYLDIVAISWCQGETESGTGNRYLSYETELKNLINQLKSDLAPYNVRGANIKPIITRTHNNFNPARVHASDIRTAQQNVAAYFGMSYIDSDAYSLGADFTHWTLTGQASHGADIYTIYNTLLSYP